MDDPFPRLAKLLDSLPHGFPRTPTGVELRILRKVFAPEDAEMALGLLPIPETAETIAGRLGRPVEGIRTALDRMVGHGQIASLLLSGQRRYVLAPFVIGIYEFQLPRMDAELAALFEEYAPYLLNGVGGAKPALARVVPVNAHIETRAEILLHENVKAMFESARSFRLMECICRKERAALGRPCSHTLETCMAFSPEENAYEGTLPEGYGRTVSKAEALAVLDAAEGEGLVHCTYNFRNLQGFVCNCCSCCCGFLRGLRDFQAPYMLAHSDYVAAVAADACTACGDCASGRCPMNAIAEHDGGYAVDGERCIGCGVCTVSCPSEALTLRKRPASQRTAPPRDMVAWAFRRAVSRSGPVRAIAQFGGLAARALVSARAGRRSE